MTVQRGCSRADDIGRLEPLRSLQQIELYGFALIQRAVSILLYGRKMDEYVLSRGALDETITLGPVEPLYCTFLSHKGLLSTLLCGLIPRSP
jgi:hypothetical protein